MQQSLFLQKISDVTRRIIVVKNRLINCMPTYPVVYDEIPFDLLERIHDERHPGNDKHHLDFRPALTRFFSRFRLIFVDVDGRLA